MAESLTLGGNTVVIEDTPAPSSSETALVRFEPQAVGQGLVFYGRFRDEPGAIAALDGEAQRVLPLVKASPQALIDYGMDVLDEVIAAARQIFELTKGVKLPRDEDAALRDLALQLDKTRQYDMTVAANVAKYREMKEKLGKLFGKRTAQAYFAAFQTDRQSLEQLTENMSGDLTERAMQRSVAANQTKVLYDANQESLLHLAERVAVLERVRAYAQEAREALGDEFEADSWEAQQAAELETLIRLLDLKVTEFAGRWFTGVALAPMLRAQQEQQKMMAVKLGMMAKTGMEKIRLILAQYAMSLDMQNDLDAMAAFEGFSNDMTRRMMESSRSAIVAAAQQGVSSSMNTETITFMAQQVVGMVNDVQTVYAQAQASQQERLAAMQDAVQVIEGAQGPNRQIDLNKVNAVVTAGKQTRSLTQR